jgi:hypothetical protein
MFKHESNTLFRRSVALLTMLGVTVVTNAACAATPEREYSDDLKRDLRAAIYPEAVSIAQFALANDSVPDPLAGGQLLFRVERPDTAGPKGSSYAVQAVIAPPDAGTPDNMASRVTDAHGFHFLPIPPGEDSTEQHPADLSVMLSGPGSMSASRDPEMWSAQVIVDEDGSGFPGAVCWGTQGRQPGQNLTPQQAAAPMTDAEVMANTRGVLDIAEIQIVASMRSLVKQPA